VKKLPHRQAAGPGNTSGGESVRGIGWICWWVGSDLLGYLAVLYEKGIQRFGGHEDEGSLVVCIHRSLNKVCL